ncbi:MAG: UDP-N-acetylmuramate dehydrogenase [Candidatus Sungbacteria bacterium]|nr:UDP-N-acetylmuramate dehydrogenase [Candidatus Sungbacteria bacterium]
MALEIKENMLLAPYTIYKIGGPARFFAEAASGDDIRYALEFATNRALPFVIMGAGSNMLVSDGGFDGVAIRINGGEVRVDPPADGERLVCDAGVMMARAVLAAAKAGFGGFEWGIGVPGTIGGSVRGNAGCFGGEMRDVLESAEIFDVSQNSKFKIQNSECSFGYRDSIFKKHPEWIILSATLRLKSGDADAIQQEVQRITMERLGKQDIGTKCCGCIFKNTAWEREDTDREKLTMQFPELAAFVNQSHIPTSFLLDRAGLKGTRMGSAVISPKHANFFINEGTASAEDVRKLIERAKEEVHKKFGVLIEEEIQYVGF